MNRISLPWQELAEDTYRSVFSQSKIAFDLSGLWLMVAVLLAFLGFGIFPQLTADDLGGVEVYLAVPVVLGLFGLVALSIFATRWTRWVTLNHLPPPGRAMSLGKAELRVGLASLEALLLGLAPLVAGFLAAPGLLDAGQIEAAFAAQAAGTLAGAFLLARSGMAINLAALQIPSNALVYAWRLSGGQTLRLLLILLITVGPAIIAAWGVEWLLEWALAPMPDLIAPEMQAALAVAMMAALGFLGVMLFTAAMALAARSLILAGDDPWAGENQADEAEQEAYQPEEEVLETTLGDVVEEPLPLSAYAGWPEQQAEEEPLLLRTSELVDQPAPQSTEQLVPVDSRSWLGGQAQQPPAAQKNAAATWAVDENVLGRKIGSAKKKQSWTRFLPTLEIDLGAESWKLAVLVVLMIVGYLFLFTDVITDMLL